MPLMKVSNLNAYYGSLQALWDISLEIEDGEIIALIGSNGAGKSTFLKSIVGSLKRVEGSIRFDGVDITFGKSSNKVRNGIVMSPEGRQIFSGLTVQENLRLGGYFSAKNELQESYDRVFELFPVLKERLNQYGGTLSGGEQQMLAIGRALMSRPRLLLLDEPSLGLAPLLTDKIFALIQTIRSQGVTIVLVEQNAVMALSIADRGYILQNGRVVASDTGMNLLESEDVISRYLGKKDCLC